MSPRTQRDRTAFDRQALGAKARTVDVSPATLEAFLRRQPDVEGPVRIGDVENLSSGAGASNGIVVFTAVIAGQRHEFVLRYATETPLIKQKRFEDEFATMRAAANAGIPVPAVYWLDADGEILGRPGCIVERLHGESPPPSIFADGIFARANAEERKHMMLSVAAAHGRLRAAAIGPDQVPHLARRGEGATAIEREYAWWIREAELANPAPEKLSFLRAARDRMVAAQPECYPERLVHGDAQFANVMFRDGEIIALLDWELAFLGHNESDLALVVIFSETLNPAEHPIPGVPTEAEYIAAYERAAGAPVVALDYFKALCLMKVCTAVLFGADTMPGAEDLWTFYRGLYAEALDRLT
jgi:aminoglycoside phosphotransferase (APT) family kinase protein